MIDADVINLAKWIKSGGLCQLYAVGTGQSVTLPVPIPSQPSPSSDSFDARNTSQKERQE